MKLTVLLAFTFALSTADAAHRIETQSAGLTAVDFASFGWDKPVRSNSLVLTHRGDRRWVSIDGDGDDMFEPGEALVFVAEHLPGEVQWRNEYSATNAYWLTVDENAEALDMPGANLASDASQATLRQSVHLEEDRVRVRFRPNRDKTSPEIWYWSRLSTLDKKPFTRRIDLSDADLDAEVKIGISLRGWSTHRLPPDSDEKQHFVEVNLNGTLVATGEWDGQDAYRIDIPADKLSDLRRGKNKIEVSVPERMQGDEPIVDVALLNFIEYEYQLATSLDQEQSRWSVQSPGALEIKTAANSLTVFDDRGLRLPVDDTDAQALKVNIPADSKILHIASEDNFYRPVRVVKDEPSALRDTENRADYLMIAHDTLMDAAKPLADFHRKNGLTVSQIDVQDVYDEFSDGLISPVAIRDFLKYAATEWAAPAPRFVLLVGDASWEIYNDEAYDRNYADWTYRQNERRFAKNSSTAYDQEKLGKSRNLIPAWSVLTYEGYAASDNGYVVFADDGFAPEMAIGRLPVVEPDEVAAIAQKVITYHELSEVGPWRRNTLWITNEQKHFQNVSDRLAAGTEGFSPTKVYPSTDEADNATHQNALLDSFNNGQLLVHFMGHGGRYIWRTGPPDIRKNHDLFTLDHLDQLKPTSKMPLILSMTCYSAPFDHPTADSIGEKFLRLGDRGAIAIFAASWRNSPSYQFSEQLVSRLLEPDNTIGEAIMDAKNLSRNRVMVETYNLLGDPATRLARPADDLGLAVTEDGKQLEISLSGQSSHRLQGRMIVDQLDADGVLLSSQERAIDGPVLSEKIVDEARMLRAYFWNAEMGIDAAGEHTIKPLEVASSTNKGVIGS